MMRPTTGSGAVRSQRDPEATLDYNTPTSFRLATQVGIESPSKKSPEQIYDSTCGVQSLQDTIYEPLGMRRKKHGAEVKNEDKSEDETQAGRRPTLKSRELLQTREDSQGGTNHPDMDTLNSSPVRLAQAGSSQPSRSNSLLSLSLDSQCPLSSIPSTPKSISNPSLRQSDEESICDGGSQVMASSEDDDTKPQSDNHDSAPQLVMPSIKMPSRRPFTERGKNIGRLKILIAGDSGVGKTCLIKSVVQICEDIVHVDPLSSAAPSIRTSARKSKNEHHSLTPNPTQAITEVYASTKPYPPWWSDIEDTKVLRRRKSTGDTVLERNLCFVDTPGYTNGISRIETMQSVLQYIEAQLTKPFSASTANEADIAGLLSGNGGFQVDVVFYLIAQELKDEDTMFLQRLTSITNVIPLIAKSDLQSPEETEVLRRSIKKLQQSEIRVFSFNKESSAETSAYTVCSAPHDDIDNMDASMLMSPDYVQPLVPSELAILVQKIFDSDNIACLRHLAAKKLIRAQGSRIFSMSDPFTNSAPTHRSHSLSESQVTTVPSPGISQAMASYSRGLSPYVQARIADHTQQEERLAQIRLAKWANDLQKSLQNERARYEAIAHGQRAVWLSEKLDECSSEGTLISQQRSSRGLETKKGILSMKSEMASIPSQRGLFDAGDPLGLLRWNEAMKRRGWIAFQVVGSFGILGALAVWVGKTWGSGSDSWTLTWPGGRI